MKKILLVLAFFLLGTKALAASYIIQFESVNVTVPYGADIEEYLPKAFVSFNGIKMNDETIYYEYGVDGTTVSIINTSYQKTYRLVCIAASTKYNLSIKTNIYFTVKDLEKPLISDVIDLTIECGDECDLCAGVTAVDNCDEEVSISVIGEYSIWECNSYSLAYQAIDTAGNVALYPFILTVVDRTPPLLEIDDLEINVYEPFEIKNYVNSEGETALSYYGEVDVNVLGAYDIIVRATDVYNNYIEEKITVYVKDLKAPLIVLFSTELEVNSKDDYFSNLCNVSDNYDTLTKEDVAITYEERSEGFFRVCYSLKDNHQNETKIWIKAYLKEEEMSFVIEKTTFSIYDEFDLFTNVKAYYGTKDISNRIYIVSHNYISKKKGSFYCTYEVYNLYGTYLQETVYYHFIDEIYHEQTKLPVFPDEPVMEEKIGEIKETKKSLWPYVVLGIMALGLIIVKIVIYFYKKRAIMKK